MATQTLYSSSNTHQLLVLLQAVFLFLSRHAPSATPLSFSYDAFDLHDFRPETDAKVTAGRIELLGDEFDGRARGRAWHKQAVQLWEASTGEAASFTASFKFSIQSVAGKTAAETGHGMTFFLAPYTPDLPQESYDGCLGLYDENQAQNDGMTVNASGDARFVAVEFDIHQDPWDPSGRDHIGVDVNSMDSRDDYTILPYGSLVDAGAMSATVVYDNGTRRLDIALVVGNATYTAAASVDLRSLLPEQVAIGFSAATGGEFAGNHTVLSFSFSSTLPTKNSTVLTSSSSTGKKTTLELGAGVAAGAVLVLMLAASVVMLLVQRSRRRSKQQYDEEKLATDGDDSLDAVDDKDFESGTGPRPIPYAQLAAATRDFAEDGKLGQGGSGSVYRGQLKEHHDARDVAIKVFAKGASMEGRKEYRSEVTVISRLRHRNLVQLIGWFHGRRRLLLVYELVSNGSLDRHLYDMEVTLTWPTRYQILLGLSSAVLYLHQEWDQCVVHGDIKPSNIMLDESFNAKLGDFGLARLINHGMSLQTMTAVAGTPGYLDPECVITGKASTESDMYSFGVVLLEVACGRRPMAPRLAGEGKEDGQVFRLIEWAWDLYGQGAALDGADERLGGAFDPWEMERVVAVGLWCAHPDPKMRPGIRQAAEALRSRKFRMPLLPPKMPVAVYLQPFGCCEMQFSETTTSVGSSVTMAQTRTSTVSHETATGSSNYSPRAVSEK